MSIPVRDISGRKFERLTAETYMGTYSRGSWRCRCDCGRAVVVRGYALLRGLARSCGCRGRDIRAAGNTIHGKATRVNKAPEYKIYIGIIGRCESRLDDRSKDYIGRGISICARWRHGQNGKTGFECFYEDMGPRPSRLHSIDRKDNNGNYEPSNCRWATKVEQGRNRRSNRNIIYRGRSITMTEASLIANVSADAISARLHKGWSPERAIETPPTLRGRNMQRQQKPGKQRFRFSDDNIRGFVANRWSPGADPEPIWVAADERFNANRGYIHKLCRDFAERHRIQTVRLRIVTAISTRAAPPGQP